MNPRGQLPDLDVESYLIPSADAGIELYVRNKRPAGMTTFAPEKILLYVHGATYPSETAFDLPIEGASMMDLIAARGYADMTSISSISGDMGVRRDRRK
jgi:hypothetical protein